jgi:hypothetical protein
MGVTAARIEQDHLVRIHINLRISVPEVTMDESGPDGPAVRLEWSQQTRYDLCKELFRNPIEVGIWSSYSLFPFNIRS